MTRGEHDSPDRSDDPTERTFAILEEMFEGVLLLDHDLSCTYLNKAAASHWETSRDELVGRHPAEVIGGFEGSEIDDVIRRIPSGKTSSLVISELPHPSGNGKWLRVRVSSVETGIMVLSIDLTSSRQDDEQLRRSRSHLETVLSCMTDGVITTDLDGRITAMNPAAERLTGWSEREASGRSLTSLARFLDPMTDEELTEPIARALLREAASGGSPSGEAVVVRQDGSRVPVSDRGAPLLDSSGRHRGAVLVLRDLTEQRRLNEMLQQSQRMEALGRLAAGVAHDFNNLLTVILGFTDSLSGQLEPGSPLRARADQMRLAVDRATALTRQLLAIGRRQALSPVALNLNDVVRDEEAILRRAIGEDVELVVALEPKIRTIRADPALLGQVIMNLAVNARDAMPEGGRLTIRTTNVDLDEEYVQGHVDIPAGNYVLLSVSDTGCGMDAATRSRIFEPFFTTKEPGRGTGLGLSTVFGIVRQSGGYVWVYSEPGHGTTFKIYLPAVDDEVPKERKAPEAAPRDGRGNETILLVEDDETVREIALEALRFYGYTVITSASGTEAVEVSRIHPGEIHILVSDVILPGIGGSAVAAAVTELRPEIRVLFLSGYTEEDLAHYGIDRERVAFLQKPFTAGALARKVREALESPPR